MTPQEVVPATAKSPNLSCCLVLAAQAHLRFCSREQAPDVRNVLVFYEGDGARSIPGKGRGLLSGKRQDGDDRGTNGRANNRHQRNISGRNDEHDAHDGEKQGEKR